jgi:hypothetical protein
MRSIRGRFAKPGELTAGNARARIPVASKKTLGRVLHYENLLVERLQVALSLGGVQEPPTQQSLRSEFGP